MVQALNRFLARHKEDAEMNQYWYSKPTIEFMAREVEQQCEAEGLTCAFLSTPSIYYSLKNKDVKARSKCMDVSCCLHKSSFTIFFFAFYNQ